MTVEEIAAQAGGQASERASERASQSATLGITAQRECCACCVIDLGAAMYTAAEQLYYSEPLRLPSNCEPVSHCAQQRGLH